MTKDTALEMAIDVIEAFGRGCDSDDYFMDISEALNACKEALEPEPMTTTDVITCKMVGKCCMTGEALEQPAQGIELAWYVKGWDDAKKDSRVEQPAQLSGNSEQLKQDHSADALKIGEPVAWEQELNTKNGFSGLKDKNT